MLCLRAVLHYRPDDLDNIELSGFWRPLCQELDCKIAQRFHHCRANVRVCAIMHQVTSCTKCGGLDRIVAGLDGQAIEVGEHDESAEM
jgi:hypothetical protein